MICPVCYVQMHQYVKDGEPQGGGEASEREYYTWELKLCPECGRLVKEEYRAKVIKHIDNPVFEAASQQMADIEKMTTP